MAKLKSEIEVTCPCCGASLVVDTNLRRVVGHEAPPHGERPELADAARILENEARRREALFEQSVAAERSRDDVLSKRFEEALERASTEPVERPVRDFDLD